ncbi:hemerythrin domain-containing protein [Hydrogenophaga defluvii]|uniref:Hemerythrin domain-containing protein n=1 Tax=Hydrogenophaga defluvii TaxID=249410 RepID=A0ABW2S8X8_9BURK
MQLFVWDHHFSTGLPELDEQHKALIDVFNRLHDTLFHAGVSSDEREAALRRAFDRLMNYARAQFTGEEQLMREAGIDERHQQKHRRQHEQFIINLREMWNGRATQPDLHGRLMGFLVSWIGLHILGVDPSMVRQMRQVKAGRAAVDAYEDDPGVSEAGQRALLNLVGHLYLELSAHARARDAALAAADAVAASAQVLHERLARQGHFDDELQAADARLFETRLEEEAARGFRSESPLSMILLDWGVESANEPSVLLRDVTRAVAAEMKRTTDLVACLGPQRVAVLLPDTPLDGAQLAGQRVAAAIAALGPLRMGVAGAVPRSRGYGAVLLADAASSLLPIAHAAVSAPLPNS